MLLWKVGYTWTYIKKLSVEGILLINYVDKLPHLKYRVGIIINGELTMLCIAHKLLIKVQNLAIIYNNYQNYVHLMLLLHFMLLLPFMLFLPLMF